MVVYQLTSWEFRDLFNAWHLSGFSDEALCQLFEFFEEESEITGRPYIVDMQEIRGDWAELSLEGLFEAVPQLKRYNWDYLKNEEPERISAMIHYLDEEGLTVFAIAHTGQPNSYLACSL